MSKYPFEKEAEVLYGDSEVYKESKKRTAELTDEDVKNIQKWYEEFYVKLNTLQRFGPSDVQVQAHIHEKRLFITTHFYDCTVEIFKGLGTLYSSDERFQKMIDSYGEGLAFFLHEAITVYCQNQKV